MNTAEEVYKALKIIDSDNRLFFGSRGADSCAELRISDNVRLYADCLSYIAGSDSVHDHYDGCEDCHECFMKVIINAKPLPAGNRDILKFLAGH